MSVTDYAETVKALRLCSAINSDLCECANKVIIAAADVIENSLTENATLRRMIGNLTDEKAALVKELHDSKSELSAAIAGRETVTNRNAFDAPLTLDELRQMDGEPVWVVYDEDTGMWALVEVAEESIFLTNNLGGRSEYAADVEFEDDGITAYRQKQKEI